MRCLNRQLDFWLSEAAPADLWTAVMSELAKPGAEPESMSDRVSGGGSWISLSVFRNQLRPLLCDLAAAAAVTLILFWNTGAWLNAGPVMNAGKGISEIVSSYTQATDAVMERASGVTGEYTRKIFFKEGE